MPTSTIDYSAAVRFTELEARQAIELAKSFIGNCQPLVSATEG
jgi:hypothetical protein